MASPRIALLVHDGPDGAGTARARDLTSRHDPDAVTLLLRSHSRRETAQRWRAALTRLRPDLVYVLDTASPGVTVAITHRARFRAPFVIDTGDLVFEMARSSGIGAGTRLPALWAGERAAHRLAHTIVARSSTLVDHLHTHGYRSVAMIPDAAPEPDADARTTAARLRRDLGLDDALVIGVLGSLVFSPKHGFCYGWDLVGALALLRDTPVRGMVIGDGDGRAWLEREAARLGVLDRVVFCGQISRDELLPWVTVMDIGLTTQTNNLAGRVRTTGKLPIYMAAGCFVLASRVGEAERVLPDDMLVDYVGQRDDDYPARLATRIRHLLHHPEVLAQRSTLPALAHGRFGRDALSEAFEAVVAGALQPRGSD